MDEEMIFAPEATGTEAAEAQTPESAEPNGETVESAARDADIRAFLDAVPDADVKNLPEAVLTELNTTSAEFTAYPSVSVDGVGTITLSGEAETVGFSDCVGKFALIDGVIMKFTEAAANAAEGDVLCRGGAVGLSSASVSGVTVLTRGGSVKVYGTLTVTAGEVAAADAETVYYSALGSPDDLVGKWVTSSAGTLYYLTGYKTTTVTLSTGDSYEQYSYTGRAVT